MDRPIILSIYIATYNRSSIIKKKIQDILSVKSEDFDIWVLDDCSDDMTFEELNKIKDLRLKVIRNTTRQGCLKDGAMPNWYRLLEECDGRFAFHLNDRDILHIDELLGFIGFLKKHQDYTAGICDSFSGTKIYNTPDESLLAIPYRAVHPTGIVFRTDLYRQILNRKDFFTKEMSYIHPHDLVLGELCKYGKMFEYGKIFNLANTDSFAKNKSFLYKKGTERSSWFSPEERTKEFEMFIRHLVTLGFNDETKKQKAVKIAKAYLFFCTFNFKYYVTDPGQTQHYGIESQKITRDDLTKEMKRFVQKSTLILKENKLLDNTESYRMQMVMYYWAVYFGKPFWDLYKKGTKRKW